jgi:hypothetical protein
MTGPVLTSFLDFGSDSRPRFPATIHFGIVIVRVLVSVTGGEMLPPTVEGIDLVVGALLSTDALVGEVFLK